MNQGSFWTSQRLGEVGLRIFNLCLVISDESSENIFSELFSQCSDLLAGTTEMSAAKSAVEESLRSLKEKKILRVTPGFRFKCWRVPETLRQHCRNFLQKNSTEEIRNDLSAIAWKCLGRSATQTTKWKDHVKQWDLGTILVGNCSAAVRWCDVIQKSLRPVDTSWSALGQLCEHHSAYTTAATLYETEYQWQQGGIARGNRVETTLRLARMYLLTNISDKAEEKRIEAMEMFESFQSFPVWLLVDVLRLQASLSASQGKLDAATKSLESVLNLEPPSGTGGGDDDEIDSNNHLTILSALRDLSTYLAQRGEYDSAKFILQRALYALEQRRQSNQPAALALLDSLAGLNRQQGELRQAEWYYLKAQRLMELWLGRGHPSVALCQSRRGVVVGLRGGLAEARSLLAEALATACDGLGACHPNVLRIREQLAICMVLQGHYADARCELDSLPKQFAHRRIGYHLAVLRDMEAGVPVIKYENHWRQALELDDDEANGIGPFKRMCHITTQPQSTTRVHRHRSLGSARDPGAPRAAVRSD
ncbi:uncharacterized protein FTOL_09014 [Fusarium torulosum]|uniref:Kinesin light chain n=1 Tax=Fusarium torulosum TaxID=33205 RepID=A0AAE8MF59_9HYPO|nr:uncharacterized protein FTOL_09014 [Fusarium torulosum]